MALLKSGDEVLLPDNVYGPSREFARNELAGWGISHRFYDPIDPASLSAALSPSTRLVWLEAPGSVTMEFPDLPALIGLARGSGAVVGARQHLGRGPGLRPVRDRRRRVRVQRRHLGPGAHQVRLAAAPTC